MYSLLTRIAWVLSILVALTIMWIDDDYFFFAIFIALVIKFFLFPKSLITRAVTEIKSSEPLGDIAPVGDQSEKYEEKIESVRPADSPPSPSHPSTIFPQNMIPSMTVEDSIQRESEEENTIPDEPSRFQVWLHDFFSDRPLAKIGGILLFLGALFFLWLIFDAVGAVGKILIGILFGLSLIGIGGFLDTKNATIESRVLIGIGIAINYLTILSARHILTFPGGNIPIIGDMFTSIFLLLNTGLAIVLAFVYRSRVLLAFGFIFAYLTPFLVDSSDSTAGLYVFYVSILTIALSFIVHWYQDRERVQDTAYLSYIAHIGMTILFSVMAPNVRGTDFIILCIGLFITLTVLLILSRKKNSPPFPTLLSGYIVIFFLAFGGESILMTVLASVLLLIGVLYFFLIGMIGIVFFLVSMLISGLIGIIIFVSSGADSLFVFSLLGVSILLIAAFGAFIRGVGSFLILMIAMSIFVLFSTIGGVWIVDHTGIYNSIGTSVPPLMEIYLIKALALFLSIAGTIFAIRLRDSRLYLFAIITTGLLFIFPDTTDMSIMATVFGYIGYFLMSIASPFFLIDRDKRLSYYPAFLSSFPIAALVMTYGLYQYGSLYFPGIALGFGYILLALIYLGYAVFLSGYIQRNSPVDSGVSLESPRLTSTILLGIPLSLITLSFGFLFRDIPGVMSLAWIVESVILYYIAEKTAEKKVFYGASIIFIIGILKEMTLIDSFQYREWFSLGLLMVMAIAVFTSLYLLRNNTTPQRKIYDILHILSLLGIAIGIGEIIPSTGTGWSILGIMTFVVLLSWIYRYIGNQILSIFQMILVLSTGIIFYSKFSELTKTFPSLFIQFMALAAFLPIALIAYRQKVTYASFSLAIALVYFIAILSLYIDHFFGTFAVSIFLTGVASLIIIPGIQQDNPRLRTIGLYIGIIVLMKIFFYDIWYGDQGMVTRVIALMVTGGILIYLSQLYGKFVSRPWAEELSLTNIILNTREENEIQVSRSEDAPIDDDYDPFRGDISADLKGVDISMIASVVFTSQDLTFTVKRASILRLAKYISEKMGKITFAPGELARIYDIVVAHIDSRLSPEELSTLLSHIRLWIDQGGSIEFIEKSQK